MYYSDETVVFRDGQFIPARDANTSLYDQSLHYGYAVFEGIRSYSTQTGTRIFKAEDHYERLIHSCKLLHIPFNYEVTQLTDITYDLLMRNGLDDAYIRPMVYCPPNMTLIKAQTSHLFIAVWKWGTYLGDNLLRLCTSSYRRPNPDAFKIEAKASGHYVNSILATSEAKEKGFDEALLLDVNGYVAEGPGANLFFEKDGNIVTAPLGHILPGITRATTIGLCQRYSIPLEERYFTIDELKSADSAFFCGTAAEIIGIKSLDETIFPAEWSGTKGAFLQKAYKKLVLAQALPAQSESY
ncbi:MAG: branched-chain amino acid transaminase [Saprospiraceae bacterium]|nr:branched-chain amino acid transaminase [Saprospiraceae bacterium]